MKQPATIKAIVINPLLKTVELIDMPNDFNRMKAEIIGCDLAQHIDCGAPDGESIPVSAWIDEEGLLKDWDSVGFTELAGGAVTLAGVIVFTGPTDESESGGGDMTSLPDYFTVEWAKGMAEFVPPQSVKVPGTTITTFDEKGGAKVEFIGPEFLTYEAH